MSGTVGQKIGVVVCQSDDHLTFSNQYLSIAMDDLSEFHQLSCKQAK